MKSYFSLESANERLNYIKTFILDVKTISADDLRLIRRIENALEEARLDGMEDGLHRQMWLAKPEELRRQRKVIDRILRKK